MWAIVVILVILGISHTESIQSFYHHSNHNPVYKFVRVAPCENGHFHRGQPAQIYRPDYDCCDGKRIEWTRCARCLE